MSRVTLEQADIIAEVSNICAGNAATILNRILKKKIHVSTPSVSVLSDVKSLFDPEDVLIRILFTNGIQGINILVLKEEDAKKLAAIIMEENIEADPDVQLNDIALSAISEAMNQMCGAMATCLVSILGRSTTIGAPSVNTKDSKTFEDPTITDKGEDIVAVKSVLSVEDLFDSDLVQIYSASVFRQIMNREEA